MTPLDYYTTERYARKRVILTMPQKVLLSVRIWWCRMIIRFLEHLTDIWSRRGELDWFNGSMEIGLILEILTVAVND